MPLSPYQQAILQEIGIPVWIPKEDHTQHVEAYNPTVNPSSLQLASMQPRSQITQEQKQTRLAQLRAQVGGDSNNVNSSKGNSNNADANKMKQRQRDEVMQPAVEEQADLPNSRIAPHRGVPPSPEGLPLSADQKVHATKWLEDVKLACVQLGLSSNLASKVMVSTSLNVNQDAIILPAEPMSLTSSQKRALWNALIEAGHTR